MVHNKKFTGKKVQLRNLPEYSATRRKSTTSPLATSNSTLRRATKGGPGFAKGKKKKSDLEFYVK